jgi:hypothetical protein
MRYEATDCGLKPEIQQRRVGSDLQQESPHAIRITIEQPNEKWRKKNCEHCSARPTRQVCGGIPDYDSSIEGITHRKCGA